MRCFQAPLAGAVSGSGVLVMTACAGCGAELPADAAFCPNCARPVEGSKAGSEPGLQSLSGLKTVMYDPSSAQESALAEGEVFHDRYTIVRRLGTGAMGIVYLAEDKVTGKPVALKLIKPALVKSTTAVQRFIREGLTAREIRHRNVIAMHDVGDHDGQLYLVMEYLEGETLRDWLHHTLQSGQEVAYEVAHDIIDGILDGLAAAHQAGVVHRDLKPENIMLAGDPAGGEYRLVILDFGIARAIDAGAAAQLTSSGSATGTPLYMAPEQRTVADTVGPPADLYAVTAMLYELLMGVPPEGRLGSPSRERDDVPAAVDDIIEKGLSSRPRSRYQTTAELRSALDQASHVTPGAQPGGSPPKSWLGKLWPSGPYMSRSTEHGRPQITRNGWIVIGVAVFIGLGVYGMQDQQQAQQPSGTPQGQSGGMIKNISGTWFARMQGSGSDFARVVFQQNGQALSGEIYDANGNAVGTVSGTVNGNTLQYSYRGVTGSGRGVGRIGAGGAYIDVQITSDANGMTQQQVLHR